MTLRHAVALALVGWYLMMPTPCNLSAPVSRWTVWESYDSAQEREENRRVLAGAARAPLENPADDPKGTGRRALLKMLCIASDDPRSNENWLPARAADEVLLSVSRVNQVKLGNPGMECCLHFGRFP